MGVLAARWRLEASAFNGEPADPDRLPDPAPLRSVSARFTFHPSNALLVQVSTGNARTSGNHHTGAGGSNLRSTTASFSGHHRIGTSPWSTTVAWARMEDGTRPRHSALVESVVALASRHTLFARVEGIERIDRSFTIIEAPDGSHEHIIHTDRHRVAQVSAGWALTPDFGGLRGGPGARGSVSFLPEGLVPRYERRRPLGLALFLSVSPAARAHGSGPHPP